MTTVNRQLKPYYDDFNPDKNYHNILFRPSYAVQTRELNQIQSIFEAQVDKLGGHLFKNGSLVIPGSVNFNNNYRYVKVVIDDYANKIDEIKSEINLRLATQSNGLVARVMEFVDIEGSDYATFYIRYTNSGNDNETFNFVDNDTANIVTTNDQLVTTCTVIETGKTSKATIDNGVYFVNGKFILVNRQTLRLAKYDNRASVSVGLKYEEQIITENEDQTLYDNASGTSNFTAPGAHRLQINLTLEKHPLGDEYPTDYVEIMQIEEGELKQKARGPEYNVLDQTLARRTYEEAGDYTVKPFVIDIKEHLLVPDSGIDGQFELTDGGDEDKYAVVLDPGLAYVRGYRIETFKSTLIEGDKARDTDINNNTASIANFGKYIVVENSYGSLDTTTYQKVTFYDGNLNGDGSKPQGSAIGSANVRSVFFGNEHRLYIFNIRDNSGKTSTSFMRDVKSVYSTSGTFTFTAEIIDPLLLDTDISSSLFYLNSNNVKTLLDEAQETDTNYTVMRKFSGTVDTNGDILLTAGANESFIEFNDSYSTVVLNSTGEVLAVVSNSLSGTPLGSSISLNVTSTYDAESVTVLIQVNKQQSPQKNKTISTRTDSNISINNGRYYLTKPDTLRIIKVLDNSNQDITKKFKLSKNANEDFYGISYLTTSSAVDEPISVEYEYFQHGNGDYFSVDSYSTIQYKDIPVVNGKSLTDYLDFRPVIDINGNVVGSNDSIHNNSIINSDVEYYLPRIDKVYVNSEGEFGIIKGSSALSPKEPKTPENSLSLAVLTLNAYTADANLDIAKRVIKNKRYTMSDIGKIENRVKNLEYYVTLSMLEQQTANKEIYDEYGLDRFKNGFIVDNFEDHSKSDWTDINYRCSLGEMGALSNSLKPEFIINAIDPEVKESNNIIIKNGIAFIDYDEVNFIHQPLASSPLNVNPYAIFRWDGDLTLNPAVDNWIDTVYNEPKVNYTVIQNGNIQQSWTTFSLTWAAGSTTEVLDQTSSSKVAGSTAISGSWRSSGRIYQTFNQTIETTVTKRLQNETTEIDEIADHLLDKVSIPYMRSREIEVTIKGMKPYTKMNFFFDGVNVNKYVNPEDGELGDPVITDVRGSVIAYFIIPHEEDLKFRTGVKVLEVTDNPENDRENSDAYANAEYEAEGVRETRMKEYNATRTIENPLVQEKSYSERNATLVIGTYGDPLAQSFLVETTGGVFATSIDLYFNKKDDESYPVTCDLRIMENGFPTRQILSSASVTLTPDEVNVSSDSSVPTTFEFKAPVYLKQGTEYCLVVWSNSNKYEIWKATMGEADILTKRAISEQPFIGVMFKSQNSSTWTEDQLSDLKFTIKRAKFKHNTASITLRNQDQEPLPLENNSIQTYQGQTYFDIIIDKGHAFLAGSNITLSGLTGGAGFTENDLNKKHVVDEVLSPTRIRIETNVTADSDDRIGGIDGFRTNTVQYSMINPNMEILDFESTSTHMYLKGVTGKSYDGDETPYLKNEPYQAISNKGLNFLNKVYMSLDNDDEQEFLNGDDSLLLRIDMNSDRDNLSPVVDIQRAIFVTPIFMIDNDENDEADGSNVFAKYMTNPTSVDNPTAAIQIYADDYVPKNSKLIYSVRVGNSFEELEEADWEIVHTTGPRVSVYFEEIDILKEFNNDFTWFQVMIQLKGDYVSDIPQVRNLRMIALGT